jgi:hypothetical protein
LPRRAYSQFSQYKAEVEYAQKLKDDKIAKKLFRTGQTKKMIENDKPVKKNQERQRSR